MKADSHKTDLPWRFQVRASRQKRRYFYTAFIFSNRFSYQAVTFTFIVVKKSLNVFPKTANHQHVTIATGPLPHYL